jgi:hypothetical protein
MDAALASRERALYRAAAQMVIGYRSGFGRPSAIYVEEGARFAGRIVMRWVGDDPGRTDGVIQSLLAGPLAEVRLLASQVVGDTLDFDLPSAADHLLAGGDDQELVDLAFLHRGQRRVLPVEAAPFRAGLELLQGQVRQGGVAAGRILEQLRRARQRLNESRLWAEIVYVTRRIRESPLVKVCQRGIAGDQLAQLLSDLDKVEVPCPDGSLQEDEFLGEIPDNS